MKLKIDRKNPFDPVKFISPGWSIEEQDQDSLKLKEIDLSKVQLQTNLKEGETYITGEENLKRIKGIKLDAKILQTLWENQDLIPESWKEKTNGNITWIDFNGTILRSPFGNRCTLYLCFDYGGSWIWDCGWLDYDRSVDDPSAVLVKYPLKLDTKNSLDFELRILVLEKFKNKLEKVFKDN